MRACSPISDSSPARCRWPLRTLLVLAAVLLLSVPAWTRDISDDPYLWLEDIDGERAMAWVAQHNKRTIERLQQVPQFAPIQARFLEIYDSAERIPYVGLRGDYLYNFWQDAKNPRGVWRRTSLAQYRKDEPAWEVVLDIDELAAKEGELWVFKGARCLPPAYRRCMISLSPGGTDAAVRREFDAHEKRWIADGFKLPLAKSNVAWRDENSLWVGTDFGEESRTESGYPRQVRIWRRGTPLAEAEKILEIPTEWVSVSGYSDLQGERRYDYIRAAPAFHKEQYHLLLDGKTIQLDLPKDVDFKGFFQDFMLIGLRSDWQPGKLRYLAGSLLAIAVDEFLAGNRDFERLFTPSERVSLKGVSSNRQAVLVGTLDNVRGRLHVMTPGKGGWQRSEIALPGPGSATVSAAADDRDDWFFSYTDFLNPTSLYLVEDDAAPQLIKQEPGWFDAAGMGTRQYHAVSADGTRIPYFVVTPKGFKADGKAPTVLYGYGGFEIPLLPRYSGTIGSAWLERGGVWVLSNIRGGGEFGPAWHNSVLQENRHKVYEDFIAVAQDLIERKITSPHHLGIMGGSQGGLLVGATAMLRPDLFNAVVSQIPLLDMKRYHKLLAGPSWVAEYGNPDLPAQWAFISQWSPYHLVRRGAEYPEMFIWTTTRDDRVHPGHARKMAARMTEQGHDVLYYERIEGGHGAGSTNVQRANNAALEWAYLWLQLGAHDQEKIRDSAPAAGSAQAL